jgi:hypothetical protein
VCVCVCVICQWPPDLLVPCLYFAEWWSFEIVGLAAGSLGALSLAMHNILANTVPLMFVIPLGISISAFTMIGNLLGACVTLLRSGKSLVFGYCDNSMREKDWRCRKRGMQAT